MKKFLKQLLIFILPLCTVYFVTAVMVDTDREAGGNDYMASIIDKHNRLDAFNTPGIIFAGGSNLAFSLNSEAIEKEFGIPVVNLGLHGGLGMEFILGELRSSIREGDIVFLSIEYLLDLKGDDELKKHAASFFPPSKQYYRTPLPFKIKAHMENTRMNLRTALRKSEATVTASESGSEAGIYSRHAFNMYGDATAHLYKQSEYKSKSDKSMQYIYWKGIREINRFSRYAKKQKVEVFFLFPNYPQSEYDLNQKVIEKIASDVMNDMEIPVLNQPTDLLFPDSLIFDTKYHLIQSGRELRTIKTIELIKNHEKAKKAVERIRQSRFRQGLSTCHIETSPPGMPGHCGKGISRNPPYPPQGWVSRL